jgi:hypothetical protein
METNCFAVRLKAKKVCRKWAKKMWAKFNSNKWAKNKNTKMLNGLIEK